jgi:two-component system nitrate/nitrite response regulator NarL
MKTVGVCETQPVTAEGLRVLVESCADMKFLQATNSLAAGVEMVRLRHPDVVVIDKSFGVQAVLGWIADLRREGDNSAAIVVWGSSITEVEALRLLQSGARGIIRKTSELGTLIACLRAVASGTSWMEDVLFREMPKPERYPRSALTPREMQVMELVEQGLKNKEIARELGIRPGTVKIHLKHIFEKTGVRGRYGLALSGLKERGLLSLPHM